VRVKISFLHYHAVLSLRARGSPNMRLLDAKNLNFHEFLGATTPQYSILSHTWEDEEVSYQEMLSERSLIEGKAGYRKIRKAAEMVSSMGYNFIWVDTCCIDKSSSAELTEAINSMFQWYKESSLCLAYLSDVPHEFESETFVSSRWFTRGWTLQELIAPSHLLFISSDWRQIGERELLQTEIHRRTSIPATVLRYGFRSTDWCIAEKMSWAAHRETTRLEDMAYCLLGLFDVNMPLLYGEGNRAFSRLQEEIVKHSNDHTIFLWTSADTDLCSYRGLLARSPKEFQHCHDIAFDKQEQVHSLPFSMTNAGLRLDLTLIPWANVLAVASPLIDPATRDDCLMEAARESIFLPVFTGTKTSIFLVRLNPNGSQYARICPSMTPQPEDWPVRPYLEDRKLKRCYIRENLLIPRNHIPVTLPQFLHWPTSSNTGLDVWWTPFSEPEIVKGVFSKWPTHDHRPAGKELISLVGFYAKVPFRHRLDLRIVVGYDSDNGECWCDIGVAQTIPFDLEEFRQKRRPRSLDSKTWETDGLQCTVNVEKEVREDRLVLSVRATVNPHV